jgi:V8-like Glu-specific endopeptidase
MHWDDSLTSLLDLLVRNYPDASSARDVAEKAGLATRFVSFSGHIDNVWMSILRQAGKSETGLEDIARVAQRDNPSIHFSSLVQQINQGAIRGPNLANSDWKGPLTVDQETEQIIGQQPTFLPISFLAVGLEVARSVVRVVCAGGLGSGFLTRDNLLITNHHVIGTAKEAEQAKIQFNYQENPKGLALQVAEFKLEPNLGFATSATVGGDDWTAVRVKGSPNNEWGALALEDATVTANDYVNIIQHPGGLPKQIALYHNVVTFVDATRVQYLTDTLPGSSGSPVFNSDWRVVALHHSGISFSKGGSNRKRILFRNEGIHVKAILKGLAENGI